MDGFTGGDPAESGEGEGILVAESFLAAMRGELISGGEIEAYLAGKRASLPCGGPGNVDEGEAALLCSEYLQERGLAVPDQFPPSQ